MTAVRLALSIPTSAIFPDGAPVNSMAFLENTSVIFEPGHEDWNLNDRSWCEKDPTWLQILPYQALRDINTGKYYVYMRGGMGGEGRLFGKCSIGVGGHVEEQPTAKKALSFVLADQAMKEQLEEVGLPFTSEMAQQILDKLYHRSYGLLFDSTNEVGTVHLGLCIQLDVYAEDFGTSEEGVILKGQWLSLGEIQEKVASGEIEFENWSTAFVNRLIEQDDVVVESTEDTAEA